MNSTPLQIRMTPEKGRGLFSSEAIARGSFIIEMQGELYAAADLPDDGLAMQVGDDLWLFSPGHSYDDCGNHSCDPNAGFLTGETALFALRDIAAGEEICWDYSTSISCEDWSLDCRCGAARCRGVVRPWPELDESERERLRPITLRYLRDR